MIDVQNLIGRIENERPTERDPLAPRPPRYVLGVPQNYFRKIKEEL